MTWKGNSIKTIYKPRTAPRPWKRSLLMAHAAGAPTNSDGLLHTVPEHHKKLRCIQQERQQRFQSGPGRQNMPGSEAIVQPQRRAYRQLQLLFRHQSTGAEKPKRPPYQQRGRDQANPNPVTSFGFILLLHSDPTISTRPEFQPTVPMPPIWRPPPSVASPNSKTSY